MRTRLILVPALLATLACGSEPPPPPAVAPPPAPAPSPAPVAQPAPAAPPAHDAIDRATFNRVAVHLDLPVYWIDDADGDGKLDPSEVAALLFYPTSDSAKWVDGGAFTPAFETAYAQIVAASKADAPAQATPEETKRRALVLKDLDQGRPTLIQSDLSGASADDKEFVKHILAATQLVDRIFAQQAGATALAPRVPNDDTASQNLFRRAWGPACVMPKTEKDPACSAIPGAPHAQVDSYPAAIEAQPGFCASLEKLPNAKALLEPFVTVRDKGGSLEAVPDSEAYKPMTASVADELRAAATALKDPNEGALRAYLQAAATAFTTNDWTPADEAWAKMNTTNSAWYLRIAPDEVYWDPCAHKAGFQVSFARVNKDSLAWQDKLVPVEQEMEKRLAARIGPAYPARKVSFHLPDFIDILWNGGEARRPEGIAIGESLPNWGPVVAEGRARTVAMSNIGIDADSRATRKDGASSLLSAETMALYDPSPRPGLLTTILHEATHNLGPTHEHKHAGKTDAQAFGGGLASMMEELKANTGTYFFLPMLRDKGIIDDNTMKQSYVDLAVWSFGHIAQGMYTATGERKAYSQLAAIQIGILIDQGALTWDPKAPAANGKDTGAFTLHFDKIALASDQMMKVVGTLKANADRKGAEALTKKYVDGIGDMQKTIAERWLRSPRSSYVYGVKM